VAVSEYGYVVIRPVRDYEESIQLIAFAHTEDAAERHRQALLQWAREVRQAAPELVRPGDDDWLERFDAREAYFNVAMKTAPLGASAILSDVKSNDVDDWLVEVERLEVVR
jgi:hypothetical protein